MCQSPYKDEINQRLTIGTESIAHIARTLPEDADIPHMSIRHHAKMGHFATYAERQRMALIEQREKELEQSAEEIANFTVDHILLAKEITRQAWERLATGELAPTLQDAARAGAILEAHGQGQNGIVDQTIIVNALLAAINLAEKRLPIEEVPGYRMDVKKDPNIRALVYAQRVEQQQEQLPGGEDQKD